MQKRLNRSICRLGLGGPKEAHVQSYSPWRQCAQLQSCSPAGANVPDDTFHELCNKSSSVAEIGDHGHNRHEPKSEGAVPFLGGVGSPCNTMWSGPRPTPVSYTHLTLPTILRV